MEVPVKGYKRLTPDNEVRLKGAYFIKVKEIIKDRKVLGVLDEIEVVGAFCF